MPGHRAKKTAGGVLASVYLTCESADSGLVSVTGRHATTDNSQGRCNSEMFGGVIVSNRDKGSQRITRMPGFS